MRFGCNFGLKGLVFIILLNNSVIAANNPFLKPGSNAPRPPVIQRPAPPPPKPIPRNPNIEFRGYYEFEGVWRVALFDKVKNQGFWLVEGELFEGIEVESFNPDTEVIKLKGGLSLSLKDSDKTVLPVPSGQVKSNKPPIPGKPASQVKKMNIPPPRRR